MESFIDWYQTSGLRILIIMLVVWSVRKFGNLIIKRTIRRATKLDSYATEEDQKRREDTLISMITTTVRVLLWVVAILLIVNELGVNTAPLLAGASVVGVALGFGAQSMVKDFVAGIFIIMENQYRVGDVVEVAGVSGVVESITMRETVLRNLDGHLHHIPNGIITVATNLTMDFARINMEVGVDYSSDIEKVERVIDEVGVDMMNDSEWSDAIIEAPHFVRVESFNDSQVSVKVLGKVTPGSQWSVAGEFRKRIMQAFEKNKIEIPFPQRVIHQAKKSR
jgi:small conductance mechanosensitive channel